MIRMEKVTIHQGDFALKKIDLNIASGEYGVLMGPTGSGKTTLLEAICGLRMVTSGKVVIGKKDLTRIAPELRNIGYVPQDSVLFPSMKVAKQIEFPLAVRNANRELRLQRVQELAEILELRKILNRFPARLSGGEKQRVALARALAFKPELLCMDEPLNSVDEDTAKRQADYLKKVHAEYGVTVLHVTHSSQHASDLATVRYSMTELMSSE